MPTSLQSFFRQNTPRRLSNAGSKYKDNETQSESSSPERNRQTLSSEALSATSSSRRSSSTAASEATAVNATFKAQSNVNATSTAAEPVAERSAATTHELPKKQTTNTQRSLPPLSTAASVQARDIPTKSSSVPSIELVSPSGSNQHHIWGPDEESSSDRNSNASPPLAALGLGQPFGASPSSPRHTFESFSPRQKPTAVLAASSTPFHKQEYEEPDEYDPLFSLASSTMTPRPPSSGHGKGRSEGAFGNSKKSGKADVPDRHDIMRKAMADAVGTDAYGVSPVSASAADLRADEKANNGTGTTLSPSPTSQTQFTSAQRRPSTGEASNTSKPLPPALGIPAAQSTGTIIDHDKPGDGSLTFDHFTNNNQGEVVVLADGSHAALTSNEPMSTTKSNGGHEKKSKFPLRPKLGSRNNSFQSDSEVGSDANNVRDSPKDIRMQINDHASPVKQKLPGHGRYATTGHTAEPVPSKQSSLAVSAGGGGTLEARSNMMQESASSSSLLPLPLNRFRRLSDAGSVSSGKKGASPSGGIAGALAASGMAGMGVGHAELLQRSQAKLSEREAAAAASNGNKKNRSRVPNGGPANEDYVSGYEGGVYLDPATGKIIERGPDHEAARTTEPEGSLRSRDLQRTRSSTGVSNYSFDGSDVSTGSGLHAAANFALSLHDNMLAPEDPLQHIERKSSPPLTPGGIGAVGGLSPSGLGERVTLDDDGWHSNDMGAQITGFAVASSKRNTDFHAQFPSVPEDDYLIEDYGCALVREILIQGRLFVSENHVCFYANIFGWVTNIVMPFSEIVSVEKRMTAYVIPNAIQIATLHAKSTFASFLSRDTTYDLIVNIWKLSHPSLQPAETFDLVASDEESVEGGDGATVVHEQHDEKAKTPVTADGGQTTAKKSKRKLLKKKLGIKDGATAHLNGDEAQTNGLSAAASIARGKSPALSNTTKRLPHRKTSCVCEKEKKHYTTVALNTTYPAVPEKLYNLIFTSGFMKGFWQEDQKLMELQMSDWAPNAQNSNMLSRDISYIKPLAGGFGPKQTKCVLQDENLHVDFDEYVTMLTTTRTPDVPSGGSFSVKTRTCITWEGGGNVSRMLVTCQVEWTGRSMLKSVIDRASIDGQKQYYNDLDKAIRRYIKEHASEFREEGDDPSTAAAVIAEQANTGAADGAGQAGASANGQTNEKGDGTTAESTEKNALSNFMDILQPVVDILSGAVGALADLSPTVLILGGVVLLLIISNLWALSSSNSVARDPLDPHRLRQPNLQTHASARSRRNARNVGDSTASYDDADGSDSAHAVATAVRDVLRDYFDSQSGSMYGARARVGNGHLFTSQQKQWPSTFNDNVDEEVQDPAFEVKSLLSLLDDVEVRVGKLRSYLENAQAQQSIQTPSTSAVPSSS